MIPCMIASRGWSRWSGGRSLLGRVTQRRCPPGYAARWMNDSGRIRLVLPLALLLALPISVEGCVYMGSSAPRSSSRPESVDPTHGREYSDTPPCSWDSTDRNCLLQTIHVGGVSCIDETEITG